MKKILLSLLGAVCLMVSCGEKNTQETNPLLNTRWENETLGSLEFYDSGRVVHIRESQRHNGTYQVQDNKITFNSFVIAGEGTILQMELQSGIIYSSSIKVKLIIVLNNSGTTSSQDFIFNKVE